MRPHTRRLGAVVFGTLLLVGCNYSFKAGSFPPPGIRTIAVQPFDNETSYFDLGGELYDQLLKELPRALGLRTAGEDVADAVVTGTIRTYDVAAPNYRSAAQGQAAQVLVRQVSISVEVHIVDRTNEVDLWSEQNVVAQGQFLEASETEEVGRAQALDLLVKKIVDGAQSNW